MRESKSNKHTNVKRTARREEMTTLAGETTQKP